MVAAGVAAAHGLAVELDAMHVLEQTIEESVGHGCFSEGGVPHCDGELAGDDGGAALHAVFDDFEHVGGLIGTERPDQKSSTSSTSTRAQWVRRRARRPS